MGRMFVNVGAVAFRAAHSCCTLTCTAIAMDTWWWQIDLWESEAVPSAVTCTGLPAAYQP